jgi:putative PIG3 family NAD(P)H quinone oxidoreductase
VPIPPGVDAVHAAAIPETFFTVWANLFRIGRAAKGQRVLIHGGTSGIGTTALMLCREFGITAFATAGNERKCAVIRQLGAEAINYHTENFALALLSKTEGHGVDVILDIMGGAYFERNLAALARDGRLVVIGFLGGTLAEQIDLQMLALKRAVITGSTLRSRSAAEKADIADDLRTHVWPVLAAGRCLPMIYKVFPLTQAAEAHRLMETGEHIGKIVLQTAP